MIMYRLLSLKLQAPCIIIRSDNRKGKGNLKKKTIDLKKHKTAISLGWQLKEPCRKTEMLLVGLGVEIYII